MLIAAGLFITSFFISAVLHDLGHLVFGLLSGYKFSSFKVGGVILLKQGGRLSLRSCSIKGGGGCKLIPPDMMNGKMPHVLYNVGGFIMNLLFLLVCGVLTFVLRDNIFVATVFCAMALANFAQIVILGIHLPDKADTDIGNAVEASKNPEALRALWLRLKIASEEVEGKSLADMPGEWFRIPSAEHLKSGSTANLILLAENRLMALGDYDGALEIIEKYKNLPSLHPTDAAFLAIDEMTVKAFRREDYNTIAALFSPDVHTVINTMKLHPTVIRFKYVLSMLVEPSPENSAWAHSTMNKIKGSYPYPAEIATEEGIMDYVDSIIENEYAEKEEEEESDL